MKLSICMIVRDQVELLQKTLPSLVQAADEVIVLDTGSLDATIPTAEKLGAKVFSFPWANDFSLARNESIKLATGDWILWVDTDELVEVETLQKLKLILAEATVDAYNLLICESYPFEKQEKDYYFRTKVFRNHKGIHFERMINEQVYDKQGHVLTAVNLEDIKIYHWGKYLNEAKMKNKKERNIALLEKALVENSQDAYYHLLLANNYYEIDALEKALEHYQKAADNFINTREKAYAIYRTARVEFDLNHLKEAYLLARQALKTDSQLPEIYNLLALIVAQGGKYNEAIQLLNMAENLPQINHPFSLDPKNKTYYPNYYKGCIYFQMGELDQAKQALKKAQAFDNTTFVNEKLAEIEEKKNGG